MFYRNRKFLEERLAEVLSEGYDSLHVPGGRSLDCTFSSFVFAWFYDQLLREKFLIVLPYKSDFFKLEITIPLKKRESPAQTAVREFAEETGIKISRSDLKLFHKFNVYEKGKERIAHTKYFFHYTKYLTLVEIPENFYEALGEISSPFFIKSTLVKYFLFPGHYAALIK
ncbi:TPA: hypothetical protein DCX66_01025 [Candidatus Nomurabacteria bacterium]|nr:hypothetical protein [Candidatus Nomurabacteria bacterium]HAX65040.1 hypothetical protein [Candidatus Nomurabacteria bacterium]HCU02011.1 hypothetical protein [Candidatus Nomurabacteria bacterium]